MASTGAALDETAQGAALDGPGDGTPFQQLWNERTEAVAAGRSNGWKQLDRLVELKLDHGIRNLWTYAALVIREGFEDTNREDALKCGAYAQRLAPDLPHSYFASGNWALTKGRIHQTMKWDGEGMAAYIRNLHLASNASVNLIHLGGVSLLLAVLAFCLLTALKRVPMVAHAVTQDLRGSPRRMLWGVVKLILVFLPLVLQLSIFWCAVFWSILLWRDFGRGERILVIICLLLVAYVPPVGRTSMGFMETQEARVVLDLYEASYGERNPETVRRLRSWIGTHPDDVDVLFALGLIHKRQGDLSAAEKYYREALALTPRNDYILTNLGNLDIAREDPQSAVKSYTQAIRINPGEAMHYFNLSKALTHGSLLKLAEADQNFEKAKSLDPHLIGSHLAVDASHPNRAVIDADLSRGWLALRLVRELWRATGLEFLAGERVWLRSLATPLPFVSPLVFVALTFAVMLLARRPQGWWRCSQCGTVSSQMYARKEGAYKVCIRCFRMLKGKEIDPKLKEEKMRQVKRYKKGQRLYDRVLPLVVPGGGYVWKGYVVRGFFALWIFFVFVVKLVYWNGLVPSPVPAFMPEVVWAAWVFVVLFLVFYLWVARGAMKKPRLPVLQVASLSEEPRRYWSGGTRR
jgi:tetratricopeptide (TPR) repeat protein